jgi:hypothetical protein
VYGEYAERAHTVAELVHAPGLESNVNRAELELLLEEMLTKPMESESREAMARIAFEHIDILQTDIKTASEEQSKLYNLTQQLDNSARMFNGVKIRAQAGEIVVQTREQAEISARIVALLSYTYEHTYAIVTRILQDKGELTDAHKTAINTMTPEAEVRHSALKELYTEFSAKEARLSEMFGTFVEDAL